MDEALLATVLDRIDADAALDGEAGLLVLAACQDELGLALNDEPVSTPHLPTSGPDRAGPGAFLTSVTVEGFRGIGPEQSLELTPGPGLTLVIGRNGSGKSSFAEALELLLTGSSLRWEDRAAAWRQGWRNLHHPQTRIEAALAVEGRRGAVTVRRSWEPGDDLEAGAAVVQAVGQPKSDLAALGWTQALSTYRPFLSYNELSALLEDGPSKLYDALEAILGLDELNAAAAQLREARRERERELRDAKRALTPLLADLEDADDPRAKACHDALSGRRWDVHAVDAILLDRPRKAIPALDGLRAVASLEGPDLAQVEAAIGQVRSAAATSQGVAGTDAEDARHVADLLEQALARHAHDGDGDCPVCGRAGALDAQWRAATSAEVTRLRARSRAVGEAHERLARAERAARSLIAAPPAAVSDGVDVGVDLTDLQASWQQWVHGAEQADDAGALAAHLEGHVLEFDEAVRAARAAANAELDRRQSAWQPLAIRVAAWLSNARPALLSNAQVPALKAAEAWLKETTAALRAQRFAPIAEQCQAYWQQLRHLSNVDVDGVHLSGSATRRRVELDVTVDGVDGAAVGVMSQGELHALALSLFLPRATLPESPFRFLLIDDPVQSMDPARVDGLARVLASVAEHRQVVVCTHDDRLAEAARRLRLPARSLEVTRRARSVVEVRAADDPVDRLLADARALASTTDLPAEVGRQVVPGFCRAAIEAGCVEAYRGHGLTRGATHLEVEETLERARTLTQKAALALFGDLDRAGDVLGALGRFGPGSAEVFKACDKGAHGRYRDDLHGLISDTARLVTGLRRQ